MSDARLRALERAFRESGDPGDAIAWLRERLRAGDLSPERLELAALWGHDAAVALLPGYERKLTVKEFAPLLAVSTSTLNTWIRQGCPATKSGRTRVLTLGAVLTWYDSVLEQKGYQGAPEWNFMQRASEHLVPGSALLGSLGAARCVAGVAAPDREATQLITQAIERVDAYVQCPCTPCSDAAELACKASAGYAWELPVMEQRWERAWSPRYAACMAAAMLSPRLPQYPERLNANNPPSRYALDALISTIDEPEGFAFPPRARGTLRAAMAAELVPWLLGTQPAP